MEHMKNKKNEPENKKAVKEKLKKEQIKEENESFENKEEQKSNKINTFLNSFQEQDPLLIENIGDGNGVFKDISDEYKYQFKSIVQGEGILITNQDDTLTISIDQDYLIGLIQQNIPGS